MRLQIFFRAPRAYQLSGNGSHDENTNLLALQAIVVAERFALPRRCLSILCIRPVQKNPPSKLHRRRRQTKPQASTRKKHKPTTFAHASPLGHLQLLRIPLSADRPFSEKGKLTKPEFRIECKIMPLAECGTPLKSLFFIFLTLIENAPDVWKMHALRHTPCFPLSCT